MGALYITCQSWISVRLTFCCFTYLYGGIRPTPPFLEYPRGESQISTWMFFIFHVSVFHFFRSFISFFRSFISFLRRIFYSPRGDFEISTWKSLFSDTAPYRYVINSKLLQRGKVGFAQPGMTHHNRIFKSYTLATSEE